MIKKITEKIGGSGIFLLLVSIIYLGIFIVDFNLFKKSFFAFWTLFLKILPILGLVFGLVFVSNLLLEPKIITKYLGQEAKTKGWLVVIIGGILSSGPIYMWYPLLADLKEKGMREAFLVVFLYNRAIKIPLLPLMIYYFKTPLVVVLTFYMILFSIINGIVVERLLLNKN